MSRRATFPLGSVREAAATVHGAFFSNVSYDVGGDVYSFNDLENGILRGNKKPPYSIFKPINTGSSDPRRAAVLEECECRVHFALNCGALSCPPVKKFTVEAIEEELRIVALAFCEDDRNVRVENETATVFLSQIFFWYSSDFGVDKAAILKCILQFLRGEKKARLDELLTSGAKVSMKPIKYDWTTNAKPSGFKFGEKALRSEAAVPADCLLC